MSLMAELETCKHDIFSKISKETAEALLRTTEELVRSEICDSALKAGAKAPAFNLQDSNGKTVSSDELLKKGPLVVSFYRGGWCPFCSLELKTLREAQPEIEKTGGTLVAISPELPRYSKETVKKNGLDFYVLSDTNNQVARSFGLVFELMSELANLYRLTFDLDLTAINGTKKYELPIPATYVIDQNGIIRHAFIDANYMKRMEPAEIIKTLKKISS